MTIEDLLHKVDGVLGEAFRDELRAQGHYNTGALDQSIEGNVKGRKNNSQLEGFAAYYALILNTGFGPEKASMKQFPFLVRYFQSKGHEEETAKRYAAMTIRAWQREGMPTSGSYAYSQNGFRTKVIAQVKKVTSGKVNKIVSSGLDSIVNKEFHQTKSETI